jgi:hypothetical protein
LKTAAQNKFAIFFFDKDVPFTQRPTHFLADNNSAEGRGDHCVTIKVAQFIGEPSTNFRSDVGMLKKQCALEIFPAVQARAQNEMALEQSAGIAEERKQFFTHIPILGSARRWRAVFGGAPKTFASRVIHMVIGNKLPFSIPRGNRSTSHRKGHASGVRSPRSGCARWLLVISSLP